jgi:AAA family ATP:ADP antiporter
MQNPYNLGMDPGTRSQKLGEFGRWRAFFWPIHRFELGKFLPMFLIYFLITFNYNAFRVFKDAMVVTAPSSGAEALPFIKVWAILPSAILMTYLFTRLSNHYSRDKVFHIMMGIFLAFFFVFTFFLYPNRDLLHPHETADLLQSYLPPGFKGFIAIFRNWTFTAFYVMSELWGTAIMTVLFWGFANEVVSVSEAKRFYGHFTLSANLAGILAGQASIFCTADLFFPSIPYGQVPWDQSVLFLNLAIMTSGLLTIILFRYLNRKGSQPDSPLPHQEPEKIKMSMRKNFAYLARSKYLICIALIVLTYNIVMNLIEVVWKDQMKQLFPNPTDYSAYMGEVMTLMGIIATLVSLFITGNVIRKFSWTVSALIPAAITLLTGVAFFTFVLFQHSSLAVLAGLLGSTPLLLSVKLGALQNALSRASKYTLFDASKELAFIPLNKESKLKGKAAIDGVGSRLGKSGGSVIHQGMLFFVSTVAASTPYIGAIFLIVVFVWILSILSLGKQFDELTATRQKLDLEEPSKEVIV